MLASTIPCLLNTLHIAAITIVWESFEGFWGLGIIAGIVGLGAVGIIVKGIADTFRGRIGTSKMLRNTVTALAGGSILGIAVHPEFRWLVTLWGDQFGLSSMSGVMLTLVVYLVPALMVWIPVQRQEVVARAR